MMLSEPESCPSWPTKHTLALSLPAATAVFAPFDKN